MTFEAEGVAMIRCYASGVDFEPATPECSFLFARFVYRGMSAEQREALDRQGTLMPERSVGTAEQIVLGSGSSLAISHVLGRSRGVHAISFALGPERAVWYATKEGIQDGYLLVVELAPVENAMIEGGNDPATIVRVDGTEWIDPRHLGVGAFGYDWGRMRSRALGDDEVLLVGGGIDLRSRRVRWLSVRRDQADPRFASWASRGEHL